MTKFVYSIYIRTTPEALWEALTSPEFTRKYWMGMHQESAFEAGTEWKLMIPDGRVGDSGTVISADRPRKLVMRWQNEFLPEMKAEGATTCTYLLEPEGAVVKLTIVHESERAASKVIDAVSQGWPKLLSSLKSLLETGTALPGSDGWPEGF